MRQSPARTAAVAVRKSGRSPASKLGAHGEQVAAADVEPAVQVGEEVQRLRRQDFRGSPFDRADDLGGVRFVGEGHEEGVSLR